MSTPDLETQAAQEANNDYLDEPSEHAYPDQKSGVRVDIDPAVQSARFFKGDLVHMSQIMNGRRIKGVFIVDLSQYNSQGGYIEYQLLDPLTEMLYKNGAWIREKELKMERRGRVVPQCVAVLTGNSYPGAQQPIAARLTDCPG